MTTENSHQSIELLRLPEVLRRTGLKRSHLYHLISQEQFESPVRLAGSRSVAWRSDRVDAWVRAQIEAGRKAAA